jgi:YidC/Oxa1 family membrane protein insertase
MIGLYMAVMMLFFGWSVPAGVLVYWVTSSVLQLVQQYAVVRAYSGKEVGKQWNERSSKRALRWRRR